MPIGKALLLKGLGGLAALGGAIGGGCYIHNLYSNKETTRFDRGLIDYLKAGGKIQFSVKDGTNEISDNFPTFTTNTSTKTATVTIKVSVGTATGNDGGTLTDATTSPAPIPEKGKKANLKKLNGSGEGADWTWICEVKFTAENVTDGVSFSQENKDKLVKANNGFFNKLKENNNKDLKIKFIKDCAAARGKDKNKKIDELTSLTVTDKVITNANEIKSTKEFELRKDNTNLIPKDQSDFERWFKNEGN